MSILRQPKRKAKTNASKVIKPVGKGEPVTKKAPARGPAKSSNTRPSSSATKNVDSQKQEDATAKLKRTFDNLAADKRENSYGCQKRLPTELRLTSIPVLSLSVGCPVRRGESSVDCWTHTVLLRLGHYPPVRLSVGLVLPRFFRPEIRP